MVRRSIRVLRVTFFSVLISVSTSVASADNAKTTWVQVEAKPDLRTATKRARAYANTLQDVQGFRLSSGWYAVVLGPYSAERAQQTMDGLKATRVISGDSYLSDGKPFRDQFWPLGGADTAQQEGARTEDLAMNGQPNTPPALPAPSDDPDDATPAATQPVSDPDPETRREALTNEALMSREQRQSIQQALQWFGFYTAKIDGSFGKGTRTSMARWQRENAYETTGVLTSMQRRQLLEDYQEALDGLGLEPIRDETAGIEMILPTRLVAFDHYDYPFAHYPAKDGSDVQVILISQDGDMSTLHGLYDIMQTLEIVPPEGKRAKNTSSFELTGQSETLESYSYARLENGAVKGFSLVYPSEKARDMKRTAAIMRDSLRFLDARLTPEQSDLAAQSVDLLAGLEIRRPKRSQSGFFVDTDGRVLTSAHRIADCARVTIGDPYATYDAVVKTSRNGMALLEPKTPLSPVSHARFATTETRLRSPVAVVGYSYGGRLGAPTLTLGTISELRGLDGDADLHRLEVAALEGDAGGPVLDMSGKVLGVLVDQDTSDKRNLPQNVKFSVKSSEIADFLLQNDVTTAQSPPTAKKLSQDALLAHGSDMTVLVGCW